MDTTIIEPEADELASGGCDMEIRLLYSIAISVKRMADAMTAPPTPRERSEPHGTKEKGNENAD